MPQPFLLIDGYNLMHAAGLFRVSYGPGQFEKWRMRFLQELSARLTPAERRRAVVVFDAPATAEKGVGRQVVEGLEVLFARSTKDADDVIEDLIAEHSAPRQILLVSSDHRLQKAARRRRGRSIDSEDFVTRLEKRERRKEEQTPTGPPREKLTGLLSEEELAEWMEVFGETPQTAEPPANHLDADQAADIDKLQREIDEETG